MREVDEAEPDLLARLGLDQPGASRRAAACSVGDVTRQVALRLRNQLWPVLAALRPCTEH